MNTCENLCIVIIGHNESHTLTQVLDRCIDLTTEFNVHVIYVDSDSDDNSVRLASSFADAHRWLKVSILYLSGNLNAAIARNAGLSHIGSHTQWIFFLDADIVFEPLFVAKAVKSLKEDGKRGTVTGRLKETFINGPTGNMHVRMPRSKYWDGSIPKHGGNFITSNSIIRIVGGFDERLTQHEDFDLCMRIRRKGRTLFLLDDWMGKHYTVSYNAPNRIWRDLKCGRGLSSGLLIRKYLFSRYLFHAVGTTKAYILKLWIILMVICGLITRFYPLLFCGLALFILILVRRNKDAAESMLGKALSFLCGINLLLGLFYFPGKYECTIKEMKLNE